MALTDEEKKRIEDEETYRASLRNNGYETPEIQKKGMGCGTVILLIMFAPLLVGLLLSAVSSGGQNTTTSTTPTDTPFPTEQACNLSAHVSNSNYSVNITNNDTKDWLDVVIKINSGAFDGGYQYHVGSIPSGQTVTIGFNNFVKGNERFNPYSYAVRDFYILDRTTNCDALIRAAN